MKYDKQKYMTRFEKIRHEKNKIIINDFLECVKDLQSGYTTYNRIKNYLADKHKCSSPGIDKILREYGIYHGAGKALTLPQDGILFSPESSVVSIN